MVRRKLIFIDAIFNHHEFLHIARVAHHLIVDVIDLVGNSFIGVTHKFVESDGVFIAIFCVLPCTQQSEFIILNEIEQIRVLFLLIEVSSQKYNYFVLRLGQ